MASISQMQRRWTEVKKRHINDRDGIPLQLRDVPTAAIQNDIDSIITSISGVDPSEWKKAIFVARVGSRHIINRQQDHAELGLTAEESESLVNEREKLTSQKGIVAVIITVAMAAFLQGHVQSSINAGSLFAHQLHILPPEMRTAPINTHVREEDYRLGIMNASPFFTAALVGAPLSLPINYYIGRRGALIVSAVLIIASSLGSSFSRDWVQLLGVRIIGGVGMGMKAISAPILASESAIGFWRGSILITWQLWVAFGIMAGFVVNLVIAQIVGALAIPLYDTDPENQGAQHLAMQLILGAPVVPSLALFVAVYFCYESPHFYLREDSPNFNPDRALATLMAIRPTRLQALRDFVLIRWSTKSNDHAGSELPSRKQGLTYASSLRIVMSLSLKQYNTLFTTTRLRNAVWSTCTVALAQQLCGINVFAFYSNSVFVDPENDRAVQLAMLYSFGYGAVNFVFGLGAMRTIDISAEPSILQDVEHGYSLPCRVLEDSGGDFIRLPYVECAFLRSKPDDKTVFTAAYAPGLGPIPFTLAAESFPLSHREAGASVAISINLFFAGVLTIVLPALRTSLSTAGTVGFFSGMNVVAFILVFFLVEETRQLSLEDLDVVYGRPKITFIKYQLQVLLPYIVKRYIFFRSNIAKPPDFDRYVAEEEEDDASMDQM
ncbi:hypothetical protein B0I35DRAFT_481042 [Stachybotrys elegans]|uniref:Major facilitator superfamily (MFS) profile domain-containing protein n=1 Tax=Stachybotrys elegans TaxID=80388 RepID=A0A8K0SMU1_9HYPO|nr:hypothetical protein B0I35DRAFT_481042 [Stachybotrys elegans]